MDKDQQSSKKKALMGLVTLTVILGLLLFISAGTLNFWRAWVYLLLFSGSSVLITLFLIRNDMELLKRRLNAGATAEKSMSQKIIQTFASFAFIAILIIPGFDHRFGWSDVPLFLVFVAEFFVLLGFYIVFRVFRENSYTSATIEIAENQQVISTGPYAVVRHPMYSGALLMLLFTPLALGSYWGLIGFILIFIVIVLRLLDEEKFLSVNLPGYTEYCQKTRFRLIPFIW
jgi:protein-S-isoprenylcysteine O-methyltransferase Ste14